MDIVTLTDPGLGMTMTPVRIVAIEEDSDGLLAVTAEEFPGATATATGYMAPTATNRIVNRNVAPAAINKPVLIEPPSQLTGGTPQIWAVVSGGANDAADPNWGGANVWISRDGTNFVQIGAVAAVGRQGLLTAALPVPSGAPDTTNTLAVDLGESAGVLSSGTQTDAQNAVTLAIVDNELLAYQTATLTASNRYALTYLVRGLYGSAAKAHATGAPFARLDAATFKYTLPLAYIGTQLTLKFQSFNIYGGGVQDISTCAAYTITPIGSGLFGPTAQMIVAGTSFDEGLASQAVSQVDDYGVASDPYTAPADDGLASDGLTTATPVSAGGTGAVAPATARANLGAAASGANTDVTSLSNLTGVGIGTAFDPTNPLSVKAATRAVRQRRRLRRDHDRQGRRWIVGLAPVPDGLLRPRPGRASWLGSLPHLGLGLGVEFLAGARRRSRDRPRRPRRLHGGRQQRARRHRHRMPLHRRDGLDALYLQQGGGRQ